MRKYPKNRKKRDVSYAKSYQIYHKLGKETLTEIFSKHGMYVAAEVISERLNEYITPEIARHVNNKYLKEECNDTQTV